MEGPSLDGLETLLVLSAPETVVVKLGSSASSFDRGVLPRSLCGKLFSEPFPAKTNIWKVSLQETYILKQKWHDNLSDLGQTCAHISLM